MSAVQAANVVRVSADQGFAQIMASNEGRSSRDEEAAYEAALCAALKEPSQQASLAAAHTAAPVSADASPRRISANDPTPTQVLVPATVYPSETCLEHDGAGWSAIVISSSKLTLKLEFVHARSVSGAAFAPVRLPRRCVIPHPSVGS